MQISCPFLLRLELSRRRAPPRTRARTRTASSNLTHLVPLALPLPRVGQVHLRNASGSCTRAQVALRVDALWSSGASRGRWAGRPVGHVAVGRSWRRRGGGRREVRGLELCGRGRGCRDGDAGHQVGRGNERGAAFVRSTFGWARQGGTRLLFSSGLGKAQSFSGYIQPLRRSSVSR
jgi:hypothetical protein